MKEFGQQQAILEAGRDQGLPGSKRTEDEVHRSSERFNSGSSHGKVVKESGASSRLGTVSSATRLVMLAGSVLSAKKSKQQVTVGAFKRGAGSPRGKVHRIQLL